MADYIDYRSKRTGEQVEALLDIVAQGGTGGGGEVQKTTEAEIAAMGFTKNQGTVTGVKMNGVSKGSSGVIDLGTVITSHQDISGKQDELVSGTNIKTINGESILGSGDLTIGGGDSGIITPQMIYPQVQGDAYYYRIPSGVFCELYFNPNEAQASGIQYIVAIFDNPPEVSMNEDYTYNGGVSYAKYHFVVVNYFCPIAFVIENVAQTYILTNGGASPDANSLAFETDALVNITAIGENRFGNIYCAFAAYTY